MSAYEDRIKAEIAPRLKDDQKITTRYNYGRSNAPSYYVETKSNEIVCGPYPSLADLQHDLDTNFAAYGGSC